MKYASIGVIADNNAMNEMFNCTIHRRVIKTKTVLLLTTSSVVLP